MRQISGHDAQGSGGDRLGDLGCRGHGSFAALAGELGKSDAHIHALALLLGQPQPLSLLGTSARAEVAEASATQRQTPALAPIRAAAAGTTLLLAQVQTLGVSSPVSASSVPGLILSLAVSLEFDPAPLGLPYVPSVGLAQVHLSAVMPLASPGHGPALGLSQGQGLILAASGSPATVPALALSKLPELYLVRLVALSPRTSAHDLSPRTRGFDLSSRISLVLLEPEQ